MTAYVSDERRRIRLAWRHRLVPAARTQEPPAIADGSEPDHMAQIAVFIVN